ncbi:uncharacterized protein LOC101242725 isoform X2 [Ciona intestinalis]
MIQMIQITSFCSSGSVMYFNTLIDNASISLPPVPPVLTSDPDIAVRVLQQSENSLLDRSFYSSFPPGVSNTQPTLFFQANQLHPHSDSFVFKVNVTKNGSYLTSYTTFLLQVVETSNIERINLTCPTCWQERMTNKHVGTAFVADCYDCGVDVAYTWSIKLVQDRSRSFYRNESSDCVQPGGEGWMSWNVTNNIPFTNLTGQEIPWNVSNVPLNLHPDDANFTGVLIPLGGTGGQPVVEGYNPGNVLEAPTLTRPERFLSTINEGTIGESSEQTQSQPVNSGLNGIQEYVGSSQVDEAFSIQEESSNSRTPNTERQESAMRERESPVAEGETSARNIFGMRPFGSPLIIPPTPGYDQLINEDAQIQPESHYQEFLHIELPLSHFARVSNKGKVLRIKPNTLLEGRTYQVSASLRNGESTGSTSYYIRVNRGPSYGLCSVIPENGFDRFIVHCFQWLNKQSVKLDSAISQNEMLQYHISYSIGRHGRRRPIYSGYSYESSFLLPASDQQVHIHVKIYNSMKARTNVCRFPVNVTRNERTNHIPYNDLLYVYNKTVGNTSDLQHELVKDDQAEILSFVNVMIDSLPKMYLMEHRSKYMAIGSRLVFALSKIKCTRRTSDVIATMRRLFNRINSTDCHTLNMATIVSTKAFDTAKLELLLNHKESKWQRLAFSYKNEPQISTIINDGVVILEKLSTNIKNMPLAPLVSQPNNTNSCQGLSSNVSRFIQELRNILLDFAQLTEKHSLNVTTEGIIMKTQLQNETFVFMDGFETVSGRSHLWVGAEIPSNLLQNQSIQHSGIASLNDSPFVANTQPMMDNSSLSLWFTNSSNIVMETHNLNPPIRIHLPPRLNQMKLPQRYPFEVTRGKISVHQLNLTVADNVTIHVLIRADTTSNRPYTISAALSSMPLSVQSPFINKYVMQQGAIAPRRARFSKQSNAKSSVKFTMSGIRRGGLHYISLWGSDNNGGSVTLEQAIKYDITIWASDCFYWKGNGWSNAGVKALPESTTEQTICSTSHLSTFTSSFQKLKFTSYSNIIMAVVWANALTPCLTVLLIITILFIGFLVLHRYILRHQEKSHQNKEPTIHTSGIRAWLRWYFGSDDRRASERVPVILRDNKSEHEQVFEVTIQTGSWPGSGTSSLASMILFGRDGKYEGRELIPPSDDEDEGLHVGRRNQEKQCLFETGSSKTFIVTFPKNLGPLHKLSIWHDHSGLRPRWFIDYIIIHDVTSNERWYFSCNTWLALDRGGNRVSRELTPVERKPNLLKHLAFKVKRNFINYHSLFSLLACARWGGLSRVQRIVHAMSMCLLILCLSTLANVLFVVEQDFHHRLVWFSVQNISWAFGIGGLACVVLLPAQIMFRYIKHDERIAILIEDTTSGNPESPMDYSSFPIEYKFSMESNFNSQVSGGLHKTSTISHGLSILDHILDEGPTSNEVVSDWLQIEKWNNSKANKDAASENCDSGHHTLDHGTKSWLPHDGTRSWLPSRHSIDSYDEEIARCMMTSPTSLPSTCIPTEEVYDRNKCDHDTEHHVVDETSYFGDASSTTHHERLNNSFPSSTQDHKPRNKRLHSDKDKPSKPLDGSTLAIDAPVIVPCEKLEPIPKMQFAPLPRKCSYVAWTYYSIVSIVSFVVVMYGAAYLMRYENCLKWFETSFSSLFWTLFVLETTLVLLTAIFSTILDWKTNRDISQTLQDLFPTVDSAPVDDYAHKSQIDTMNNNVVLEEPDPCEIKSMLRERRRSRYLRNISPPYDHNGRWRSSEDSLRKQTKDLRRKFAVRRAWRTWTSCIFLVGMLLTIVMQKNIGAEQRMLQTEYVRGWFDEGFKVNENLIIEVDSSGLQELSWFENSSFESWIDTLKRCFSTKSATVVKNSTWRNPQGSYVIVGSVHLKLWKKKLTNCMKLPGKMEQIVSRRLCTNQTTDDNNVGYYITNKTSIDLMNDNVGNVLMNLSPDCDGFTVSFMTFNAGTKQYSLAEVQRYFKEGKIEHRAAITVQTSSLGAVKTIQQDASVGVYVILLVWSALFALSSIITIAEYGTLSKLVKTELSVRSLSKESNLSLILDTLLWITVVCYLISWRLLRYNAFTLATELESSGHAGDNYPTLFTKLFDVEYMSSMVLVSWTVLMVIKFVNLTISLHGPRSSFSRCITATCNSTWKNFGIIFVAFCFIVILLAVVGYLLFGTLTEQHSSVATSIQQVLSSVWFGLVGGNQHNNLQFYSENFGLCYSILYYGVLFLSTRILLKAFVISSHQAAFHEAKSNKRIEQLCHHKGKKISKNGDSGKGTRRSSISAPLSRSHKSEHQRYVSFSDMFEETVSEVCNFLEWFVTSFCGTHPQWFKPMSLYGRASNSNHTSASHSQHELKVTKCSEYLEKKKIGELPVYVGQDMVSEHIEDCITNTQHEDYKQFQFYDEEYKLPVEVALSEVELQVNELYERASALIDEAMEELPNHLCESDDPGFYSFDDEICSISKQLAQYVNRHDNNDDDDVHTIFTSYPSTPSRSTSIESTTSTKINKSEPSLKIYCVESCKNVETQRSTPRHSKNKSDSFRLEPDQKLDSTRSIKSVTPHETRSKQRSKLARKELTATIDRSQKLIKLKPQKHTKGIFPKWSRVGNLMTSSKSDITSSPDLPTLTRLNLNRHNTKSLHHKGSASSHNEPGTSNQQEINAESAYSSSSSQLKSDSESSHTKSWREFLGLNKRSKIKDPETQATKKARPLHRSQTVFIDIKQIPTVGVQSNKPTLTHQRQTKAPCFPLAFDQRKQQRNNLETARKETPGFCEDLEICAPGMVSEDITESNFAPTTVKQIQKHCNKETRLK